MVLKEDLKERAQAKLKDAEILLKNDRLDSAVYLSGYVMELTLKAKICDTLNWAGFPETRAEFQNFASLKTHNLDVLLAFSGLRAKIYSDHFLGWNNIKEWKPEMRYDKIDAHTLKEALVTIDSIRKLIKIIK